MLPRLFRSDGDVRKQQIMTLKIFNDNVSEVTEGHEYQIPFMIGEIEHFISIILNNDFPKDKPILKVNPIVIHPWVNSEGEITSAPGLLNFTVHSDLGRVVRAIIREFETNLPLNGPNSTAASPSITIKNGEQKSSPIYSGFPPAINSFSPPSNFNYHPIHYISSFPELKAMTNEELQFLNENPDRLQEFIEQIPLIKEQNALLEDNINKNIELAEANLSRAEHLESIKKNIELKIEEVTKLAFENERLHVTYQNLSDKYSPRNIQEKLRIAATQADQESDKIAESFLNREMDVDLFLAKYLEIRTLCQARKTKEEKLSHQLDSLERAGF